MTIIKEQLIFDPSEADSTDNVGAFVRSSDGTLITHTTDGSKQRIDVSTGLEIQIDEITASLSTIETNQLVGISQLINIDNNLSLINSKTESENLRQQILKAEDRDQIVSYSDFGTINQRITQIDYLSPTIPSVIARKTLTYVLEGTKYKRTNITWSII